MDAAVAISPLPAKRLDLFERYLSLWVLVCMVAGILVGKSAPETIDRLSHWEFLSGSQVNAPIAILIWLMIYPMMLKIDFGALKGVAQRPKGLFVTLFVNWLIKPFSMAFLGWLFVQVLFSHGVPIPFKVLLVSVLVFIVIPLLAGCLSRAFLIRTKGRVWFERQFLPLFRPVTIVASLVTLVLIFAFQAQNIVRNWTAVILLAIPIIIQVYFNSSLAYGLMRLFKVRHNVANARSVNWCQQLFRTSGRCRRHSLWRE
jgi:ACR3 family arsenite efflux pump ArsB